ncbi:MAG: GAF domain-containing protein, partial [Gammaproteobacteria bacterium]
QNWIETNIGKLATLIQQAETESELAANLLSYISPLMNVGYAALYAHDVELDQFCLTGGYGSPPGRERSCFSFGESLVGQCALEKIEIILSDLPDDYIHIHSALGEAKPKHLCLRPVILQGRVIGVLELASFSDFSGRDRRFLSELMPALAMTMEVLSRNLQTRKLLAETQQQAERMEKQAALLEEQTVELEAQQAELKDTETWYYSIIESAPHGMLVTDEAGKIILCNPMAEHFFGYDAGELMGKQVDSLLPSNVRSEYPLLREKFLASESHRTIEKGMVINGLRKDSSEFRLEASFSLLPAMGSHDKCIFISVREAAEPCAGR